MLQPTPGSCASGTSRANRCRIGSRPILTCRRPRKRRRWPRSRAQASAKESARVATVLGIDDKVDAAADSLATRPGSYRPGTLAALADAYDSAGEPVKAGPIRRLAEKESFLRSFAGSGVEAQGRLIESLTNDEDRAAAEAIRERQAEAFTKDAFGVGTALYPDVGPPKPIDDIEGRIAQARAIAAYRGIPVVPFTGDELTQMRRQYAQARHRNARRCSRSSTRSRTT